MKKFTRILALLLAVLTLSTACSSDTNTSLSPRQQEAGGMLRDLEKTLDQPNEYRYEAWSLDEVELLNSEYDDSYQLHQETDKIDFPIERVNQELEDKINALGKEVNDFMKSEYGFTKPYTPIEVYWFEGDPFLRGRYMPIEGVLVLNKNCKAPLTDLALNVAVTSNTHELVHYIMHANLGSPFVRIYNSNGDEAGLCLHEAITEYVTYTFMKKVKNVSPLRALDGEEEPGCSAYELLLYNIDCWNATYGFDFVKEVLAGNIDSIEEIINEGDAPFVVILNELDLLQSNFGAGYHTITFYYQFCLSQYYFWQAKENPNATKRLRKLTEEYLTRTLFIEPKLRTANDAVAAWYTIAEYFNLSDLVNSPELFIME